jgi:hypothetical protein
MSQFSTMSSKGQLTVPQEIRKRLGLETGDRALGRPRAECASCSESARGNGHRY